jgi:hypothetical protein
MRLANGDVARLGGERLGGVDQSMLLVARRFEVKVLVDDVEEEQVC